MGRHVFGTVEECALLLVMRWSVLPERADADENVRRGSQLPLHQQGIKVLGTPGTPGICACPFGPDRD